MTEQTMNQYAPPVAGVADVLPDDGRVAELKLFSAKGRIGRLRYLAYSTGAWLIYSTGTTGAMLALGANSSITAAFNIAAFVVLLWFGAITNIKRCHDIGISGWWSLASILPIVTLIWTFKAGDDGGNLFGPKPPPNTWGVRVLGLLLPVVMIIGILAAIALPAYKTYTDKARAAQAAQQ